MQGLLKMKSQSGYVRCKYPIKEIINSVKLKAFSFEKWETDLEGLVEREGEKG